jgi:hypothetical protein
MLANAGIQNAATLQGLPLDAAFDGFPVYLAASWIRGEDTCGLVGRMR